MTDHPDVRLILIVGACGVGKSAVAAEVATQLHAQHVDVDEIRKKCKDRKFGLMSFDLLYVMNKTVERSQSAVVDLGGDTMFRQDEDAPGPETCRRQVQALNTQRGALVILLRAGESELRQRFLSCKGRTPDSFDASMQQWAFAEPHWMGLADLQIETDGKDTYAVSAEILEHFPMPQ